MENEMQPKKAFIVQVVTVVHTCHSHNIPASRKRLEAAMRLFFSVCRFDALYDSLVRETLDEIISKLSRLRYTDGADAGEVERIKSDCLVTVRRLHELANRMELRDADDIEAEQAYGNSRSHAFGWMQATG